MEPLTKQEAALVATVLAQKISRIKMQRISLSPAYKQQMPVLQSALLKLGTQAQ